MKTFSEEWFNCLDIEIKAGNIRVGTHPYFPLKIYNYTSQCQFSEHWNEVTRRTRGLILNDKNLVVVPPGKFFNIGEPLAAKIDLDKARISIKSDGYMIMIKIDPDWGLIVASRGSFDNKYVEATRKFLTDNTILRLVPGYTYFCELLQNFPGDESIIVTRHPIPKLVCWAIRDENFNEVIPDNECPFPIVKELSLAEAKEYLTQKVEGVVAQDRTTGERIKIKTAYFLERHKLISNCTKKRVWDLLVGKYRDGIDYNLDELDIPDEFMQQMKSWEKEFLDEMNTQIDYYTNLKSGLSNYEISQCPDLTKYDKFMILAIRKHKKGFKSAEFNILNTLNPLV